MNTLLERRRMMMASASTLLPKEYQQVEYLQSTGTQYIEIPCVSADVIGFSLTYKLNQLEHRKWILGQNANRAFFLYYETNPGILYSSVGNYYSLGLKDTSKHTIELDSTNLYVDSILNVSSMPVPKTATSFWLFSCVRYNYPVKGNIYLFRLKSTLQEFELYPCYRKSDNKPGFYDIVNNTFLTNMGTGEFTVGPVVGGA